MENVSCVPGCFTSLGSGLKLLRCVPIRAELQVRAHRSKSTQGTKDGLQSLEWTSCR